MSEPRAPFSLLPTRVGTRRPGSLPARGYDGFESAAGEPGADLAAAPGAERPGRRAGSGWGASQLAPRPGPAEQTRVAKAAVADTDWKGLMATETGPPARLDPDVKCPSS